MELLHPKYVSNTAHHANIAQGIQQLGEYVGELSRYIFMSGIEGVVVPEHANGRTEIDVRPFFAVTEGGLKLRFEINWEVSDIISLPPGEEPPVDMQIRALLDELN